VLTRKIVFPGDREEIRERAAQAALALLWKLLKDPVPTQVQVAARIA
jgi:nicotinamide mononucleotide (NMN) deamidase PncC